jgi:hypothetical protein
MQSLPHDFGLTALSVLTPDTAPDPARIRRETVVLDGIWSLSVNGAPSQPVQVPFAPQARVNSLPVPDGEARLRYATTFELPANWDGALLHLEGVDREAEIAVNGVPLGRHEGAWDPVALWIPPAVLRRGLPGGGTRLHALVVEVRDDSRDRSILAGKQERDPGEGVIFYGNMSGIWKSVWLERAGRHRIASHRLDTDSTGRLTLDAALAGATDQFRLRLTLADPEGDGLALEAPVRDGRARLEGRMPGARPWSPDSPSLYFGRLSLLDASGAELDGYDTYAGFRDFRMEGGWYRLNGEPFHLRGLLNQAIYPDTLYTPTDAHTLTDFDHSRAMGFNGERRHQTTPRHRDLWLADRLGYWLSIELPSARNLRDPAARTRAIREWERIVAAYAWGHPSVFFLVPGNENWGLLDHPQHETGATDAEREAFQYALGRATERCAPPGMPYCPNDGWKLVTTRRHGAPGNRLDPSRLMLNVHDYADTGRLRATYGGMPLFPEAGTWGGNPGHVFHSDAYGYDGATPVMLSECGGRALLNRPAGGVFAYGMFHRDPEAWAREVAEMIRALGEMPVLRGGYVLTQTRDAGNDPDDDRSAGEINGLLDGRGVPKYDGPLIREANEAAHAAWLAHRRGWEATDAAA